MRGLVLLGALLGLAAAGSFFALRAFPGDGHPPKTAEDWLGDLAFLAVYAAPSLLALIALRGRPSALLPAAVLSALLSWTAFSGVTLVLLIPATMYAAAYVALRGWEGTPSSLWSLPAVAAGYAAFWALFARDNPYCWEYVVRADATTTFATVSQEEAMSGQTLGPTEREAGGGCDDRITLLESLASLGLTALALTAAAFFSTTREAGR